MTFCGIPSASLITERSWEPKLPSRRHMRVVSGVTAMPHSSCRAVWTISSALWSLSWTSVSEKSLNLCGKVPDWPIKYELGPMISDTRVSTYMLTLIEKLTSYSGIQDLVHPPDLAYCILERRSIAAHIPNHDFSLTGLLSFANSHSISHREG